ncbi:MAG: type IV toxin-antitoxin system AbiEi family antitoxin domain-containing protein [Actinomycetota bacterium]|nr:type IV toxin-antitoxin system AbiEi family antitoxin domain-containing protein [Actinomycetota bacterium]
MELARAVEKLGSFTADQWGLVTTAQAKSLGVSAMTLGRLVRADLLERVQQGCYLSTAVGAEVFTRERVTWLMLRPSVPAWERPALDPDGGVLSHATAAYVNGWGDLLANVVTLTVPRRRTSRYEDVRYLIRDLAADDVVLVDGLPTTTAERTVVDLLTEHTDGGHIGQIIYEAFRRDRLDVDRLAARIGHLARHYGVERRDGRALIDRLLDQGGHLADELAKPRLPRHTQPRPGLWMAQGSSFLKMFVGRKVPPALGLTSLPLGSQEFTKGIFAATWADATRRLPAGAGIPGQARDDVIDEPDDRDQDDEDAAT